MVRLTALMRRVSDTTLFSLALSIFGTLICYWYLWWYVPLRTSHAALTKQQTSLSKRIASLKKRLDKSTPIPLELAVREQQLSAQAALLTEEPETLTQLLATIKESGVQLISWKPGDLQQYEYYEVRILVCELVGPYEQLIAVLKDVGCVELAFTKTPQEIHARCVFELVSKKRSL